MPQDTAQVLRELTPTGRLRAAINLGNAVLAQRDEASGELRGVSVELSLDMARRLGIEIEHVTFDAAGKVFDALAQEAWDVAFLALDPVRADRMDFTAPYVLIEATYLVDAASPFRAVGELDAVGHRIAVSRGAAYDLVLQRELKHAKIVHAASPVEAFEIFNVQKLDALAGVRQALMKFASGQPLRVLDDAFVQIWQAVATPKGRPAAHAWLQDFIRDAKANSLISGALRRSGQSAAVVAA